MELSVAQSVVLRDHVKTGNNGLLRMKQCIEAFAPGLKGILLRPTIVKHGETWRSMALFRQQ